MPGAHYTNQCIYSTPRVGGSASAALSARVCVESGLVENPSKTRPKSDRFHECEFSTPVTPITYNFNALKCTDFSAPLNRNPIPGQTLAAKRAGSPDKMGKNGTSYDSHKIERLRRSHLRRLPFAMSRFQFSLRNSPFLRMSSLVHSSLAPWSFFGFGTWCLDFAWLFPKNLVTAHPFDAST